MFDILEDTHPWAVTRWLPGQDETLTFRFKTEAEVMEFFDGLPLERFGCLNGIIEAEAVTGAHYHGAHKNWYDGSF